MLLVILILILIIFLYKKKKKMKTYKCPYCLHEFTKEDAKKIYKNGSTIYKCPNDALDADGRLLCGERLPDGFFESNSKVISLVGGVGVGKTFFFMALERILKGGAINNLGINGNMIYGDEDSEKYFKQISKKFDETGSIDATKKDAGVEKHALGLEIHIDREGLNGWNRKKIYLSFFDNPGEGFDNPNYMVENMNLHKSDAVIFLISPEQLENFVDLTKSHRVGLFDEPSPIAQTLNNVINVVASTIPEWKKKLFPPKIDVPFAFCISKFDNFKESFSISIPDDLTDKEFFANNRFKNKLIPGNFSKEENGIILKINEISSSIESIVYGKLQNAYMETSIRSMFSKYRYFGVESIRFEDGKPCLAPKGIALPLIWVLHNLKQL